MKVLIVTPTAPTNSPMDGRTLALYHLMQSLEGVEVQVVAADEVAGAGAAAPAPSRGLPAIPSSMSGLDVKRFRRLAEHIRRQVRDFHPDVLHVTGNALTPLVRLDIGEVSTLLAALDAPFLNVRAGGGNLRTRWRQRVRAFLLRDVVRRYYDHFDRVVLVSQEDADAVLAVNPKVDCAVIPNGVEVEHYAADPMIARVPGELLFTGALGYPPNVDAARLLATEVFPTVKEAHPAATLRLVGRDPAPAVSELGELEGVTVVGPVPEMRSQLSRASVYVCPMVSGTGIKNKLLEAMANGLPCVASPLAIRGMQLEPGTDVLIGGDPRAMAERVLEVIGDPTSAVELGKNGLRYVQEHHTWKSVAAAYRAVYTEIDLN